MAFEYKQFYRRKLPHIHSPGATLFVTFRLTGSIPKSVLEKWKYERDELERLKLKLGETDTSLARQRLFNRRWFGKFEEALHRETSGPLWLSNHNVSQVVADALHFLNASAYTLHAFSIMSNHVHVVFTPNLSERSISEAKVASKKVFVSSDPTLERIMKSIKGYTAREANKILCRKGAFWETESYDHEISEPGEFGRVVRYVLNNPVKAGLVEHWSQWRWNWLAPELDKKLLGLETSE